MEEGMLKSKKEIIMETLQIIPEIFFEAYAVDVVKQPMTFQMQYNSDLIRQYFKYITDKNIRESGYCEFVFHLDQADENKVILVTMT